MNKLNLYYCYSVPLRNYLYSKGVMSLHKGIHESTNKNFWVFVRCDELDKALTEWSNKTNIITNN